MKYTVHMLDHGVIIDKKILFHGSTDSFNKSYSDYGFDKTPNELFNDLLKELQKSHSCCIVSMFNGSINSYRIIKCGKMGKILKDYGEDLQVLDDYGRVNLNKIDLGQGSTNIEVIQEYFNQMNLYNKAKTKCIENMVRLLMTNDYVQGIIECNKEDISLRDCVNVLIESFPDRKWYNFLGGKITVNSSNVVYDFGGNTIKEDHILDLVCSNITIWDYYPYEIQFNKIL